MLQDSLDHGGEHFDDHHGPGPLSAVLGRQQGTVRAEPSGVQLGPPALLPQTPCSTLLYGFLFPLGRVREVGRDGTSCLLSVLI